MCKGRVRWNPYALALRGYLHIMQDVYTTLSLDKLGKWESLHNEY